MLRFAARDLMRQPLKMLLMGGAVFTFTLVTASAVTLSGAVNTAVERYIIEQPAVVVKRSDSAPMPIDTALARLKPIPGVIGAWPRIHDAPRRLPDGTADDIALQVFHPLEAQAMVPEIASALPWSVDIITRESNDTYMKSRVAHRTSLWMLLMVPTILTLVYLIAAYLQSGTGDVREIGIQKAVGWRTRDIVTLSLYRAALLGLPPVILGGIGAYLMSAAVDTTPIRLFLLGPEGPKLPISLSVSAAWQSILCVTTLVMVLLLIAALIPAVRGVLLDPGSLIRQGKR